MNALLHILLVVGGFIFLVLSPAWFFIVLFGLIAVGLVSALPGWLLALLGLGIFFGGDDCDV